jgi:hypothetical protein
VRRSFTHPGPRARAVRRRGPRPAQGILPAILPAILAMTVATGAGAASITLQPGEAGSKDVFLYEFGVDGVFGIPSPRTTNLDTETLDRVDPDPNDPVPFGSFLAAADTDPFTQDGVLREHDARTLLQFDLGGVTLAKRIRAATLTLTALGSLGAFDSPTAGNPVVTELRAVTEAWGETTATWDAAPSVAATVTDSFVQDFGMGKVSFDVTDLVRGWFADPSTNFGVELSQRGVAPIPQGPGERPRFAASLYASSAFGDPSARPVLEIAPVPVPAAGLLLVGGVAALGALGAARRRGRRGRRGPWAG